MGRRAARPRPLPAALLLLLAGLGARPALAGQSCSGSVSIYGYGPVMLTNSGANVQVQVAGPSSVVAKMDTRVYFSETCAEGSYSNERYLALQLLGKTFSYTTDISGAGCGCNVALYLVSMRQNPQISTCNDYYCDANSVCGVSCAEVDIQEANKRAWHSTLHSASDHNGVGGGYGGGVGWNGPRDFTSQQFGPGSLCIDTSLPIDVAVSFPVNAQGQLEAMTVTLTQKGKNCPLTINLNNYADMSQIHDALQKGMTPVISYWKAPDMLWMDGKGADNQGPCSTDAQRCGESVKFYDFKLYSIGGQPPLPVESTTAPSTSWASFPPVVQPWPGVQPWPVAPAPAVPVFLQPVPSPPQVTAAKTCPGSVRVDGYGQAALTNAGSNVPGEGAGPVEVFESTTVFAKMDARVYFSEFCTEGSYSNERYSALQLLGKTLRYTTDISGAGCGCNAALYLVSMKQNPHISSCNDYYCDANSICGISCVEIDIQEANKRAWHSTLHSTSDRSGVGGGYGGGVDWTGPRDFNSQQFGPGASCIDTSLPIDVAVSFPLNAQGKLEAMIVTLTQKGKKCPLTINLNSYAGMAEIHEALQKGMTPVISYWKGPDMLWMDGKGADNLGPCAEDAQSCGEGVKFYDFRLEAMAGQSPLRTDNTEPWPVVQPLAGVPTFAPLPPWQPVTPATSLPLVEQPVPLLPTLPPLPTWLEPVAPATSLPLPMPVAPTLAPPPTSLEPQLPVPKTCPGSVSIPGYGPVALTNSGSNVQVQVAQPSTVVAKMDARVYFSETCVEGSYSNERYLALKLLGKTLSYTTDISGAGCGCNAALYLVSMKQNPQISTCNDYYCDANSVCGISCAEIDIQEANKRAWHSTLHSAADHNGVGGGYGGGVGWNGPRDFNSQQFGPGASCIDTSLPIDVAVSFPINAQGQLEAVTVTLTQKGKNCPLTINLNRYADMSQIHDALQNGMTPVISYWKAADMLWMDGKGADNLGPCAVDAQRCGESVKFYDFKVYSIGGQPPESMAAPSIVQPWTMCPGSVRVEGHGQVALTNANFSLPGRAAGPSEVIGPNAVVANMDARVYFSETCKGGSYSSERYSALQLLGKTFRYTTDISGAGCGCKAALYLVSMGQNPQISTCNDYYCDANSVCGASCTEVDIQEANRRAWHSTLHSASDHIGLAGGYGGGISWNGPRDFSSEQYGPGAACIDTSLPIDVAVSFPLNAQGHLEAMTVTLTQSGKNCPLTINLNKYASMGEVHEALQKGMTPVISYWKAPNMLWMDGKGADNYGPCIFDEQRCGDQVKFYDFRVEAMTEQPAQPLAGQSAPPTAAVPPPPIATPLPTIPPSVTLFRPAAPVALCSARDQDCRTTQCCSEPGMQCYSKNQWWATCREICVPGIDPFDEPQNRQPWACTTLGQRSVGSRPPVVDAEVVLKVDQMDLPPNAADGMDVALVIGDKRIRAHVIAARKAAAAAATPAASGASAAPVAGGAAIGPGTMVSHGPGSKGGESSGYGPGQDFRASSGTGPGQAAGALAWSLAAVAAALLVLVAFSFWAWRSRFGMSGSRGDVEDIRLQGEDSPAPEGAQRVLGMLAALPMQVRQHSRNAVCQPDRLASPRRQVISHGQGLMFY